MSLSGCVSRGRGCAKHLVALAASVALVVGATGCLGDGGNDASSNPGAGAGGFYTGGVPGDDPHRGGVLKFAISPAYMVNSLDPASGAQPWIHPQIFDQLVTFVPGSEKPQPALAESWKISKDGLTYDFRLRADVRFSNGQPLTAEDVAFSLRRLTTPVNQSGQFIFPDTFKSIDVVDKHRVRFVLNKPVAAMLYYLGNPVLSIVPKSVVSKIGAAKFAQEPIGSGPFTVKSYNAGKSLELVRNPDYWRSGRPYLDGVNYTVTGDANQRVLSVRSNQADVADSIPYAQIGQLVDTPGVVMSIQRFYGVDDVFWNTSKAPLSDVKVRQALAYATPIKDIIESVYHGYAEPANTIMPKMSYWDKSAPYYSYNLEKAKKLLAESSVPDGFSVELSIGGGDPDSSLLATILQSAWQKIGVKAKIRQSEVNALLADLFAGKYEISVLPHGFFTNDVAAPDNAGQLVYDYETGTNGLASFYNNPSQTRRYRQAAASSDESLRKRNYRKLQEVSQEQAQLLPVAFVPVTYLLSPHVRNFTALGSGLVHFDRVYLD
jgi:peptide/nickel transport system substrate-binding protein